MDRGRSFQAVMATVRGGALAPPAGRPVLSRWLGTRWLYLPCLIGAAGVGMASTLFPLQALLVLVVVLVVAAVWRWPVSRS